MIISFVSHGTKLDIVVTIRPKNIFYYTENIPFQIQINDCVILVNWNVNECTKFLG